MAGLSVESTPKPAPLGAPTDVGEPKEIEGIRFTLTAFLPSLARIATELEEARLFGMQLEVKATEPSLELCLEPHGFVTVLKSHDKVVGPAHDDHITLPLLSSPLLNPQVEHVMQVHIRQQWRCASTLRCAYIRTLPDPVFQNAGLEPLFNVADDALVRDSVLDEPHQPLVIDGIKETTNVCIQHPVHLLLRDPNRQRCQRIVLTSPLAQPVGEAEKIDLVDGIENLGGRPLDNLVLDSGYADEPLPPILLRDSHPSDWSCSVRSATQSSGEVLEVSLKVLRVLLPRYLIDPWCGFPLETEEGLPESVDIVDVVPERAEPLLPILLCCLPYPLQLVLQILPALRSGPVSLCANVA